MGKVIIENFKQRRKELGKTQQDLSSESGVNISIIKQIESGRTSSTKETIIKLAEALNSSLNDIYIEEFKTAKVITICNHKGGSGKSSITVNLSHTLVELGNKVLVIDTDGQMNSTKTLGKEQDYMKSIFHALDIEESLLNYIQNTNYEGLDIVISDYDMSMADMMMFTKMQRETIVTNILRPVLQTGYYDYIIIDTNPTLGLVNLNCMGASNYALIPIELSKYGIDGLETLTKFINGQVKKLNPEFDILGVLFNKVDKREKITEVATGVVQHLFGDYLFNTEICIDTSIKKAQWQCLPIRDYDKTTRAAKQYLSLAQEVIKNAK